MPRQRVARKKSGIAGQIITALAVMLIIFFALGYCCSMQMSGPEIVMTYLLLLIYLRMK